LILGADNIALFDSWHQPEEVIKLAGILVGNRCGFEQNLKESKWADRIKTFEMPFVDISSTMIRRLLGYGSSIRYLVPEPVRQYISGKGLYR
jgi:nicotinate-nucleotide adenylyltransferase